MINGDHDYCKKLQGELSCHVDWHPNINVDSIAPREINLNFYIYPI